MRVTIVLRSTSCIICSLASIGSGRSSSSSARSRCSCVLAIVVVSPLVVVITVLSVVVSTFSFVVRVCSSVVLVVVVASSVRTGGTNSLVEIGLSSARDASSRCVNQRQCLTSDEGKSLKS